MEILVTVIKRHVSCFTRCTEFKKGKEAELGRDLILRDNLVISIQVEQFGYS